MTDSQKQAIKVKARELKRILGDFYGKVTYNFSATKNDTKISVNEPICEYEEFMIEDGNACNNK